MTSTWALTGASPTLMGTLPALRSNTSLEAEKEGHMGADQHSALGLFLRRCSLAFEALPFEVRAGPAPARL